MADTERYPIEDLNTSANSNYEGDDGTILENVADLASAVIGRRIVSAVKGPLPKRAGVSAKAGLTLTLDDGTQVTLADTSDCCAYTDLEEFFLDPSAVDHVILGVGTTGEATTWHIYADFGDIMRLKVGWSPGNPFYYGYGFDISVIPAPAQPGAPADDEIEGTDQQTAAFKAKMAEWRTNGGIPHYTGPRAAQ